MDLDNFISDLSSESPAPGGGAASAVMGVLGTALTSMVCALTEGREIRQRKGLSEEPYGPEHYLG